MQGAIIIAVPPKVRLNTGISYDYNGITGQDWCHSEVVFT